jgi:hypothetical protein
VANASTWTVDDDKAQCPNAAFTSIQAAIDQAAPWDTVVVCAGDYAESSVPLNHVNTPAAAGSMNGLTISKPLTIKGAGASLVTIHPAASLGTSLAGTVPYLRDGGGNVISVVRQSLGTSDFTENFVSISGVTVTSPNAYVDAGIAFFNTSGRVADSVVGPLAPVASDTASLAAKPHGYGVVSTNSLIGAGPGTVRREVTVSNSLVTGYQAGGVLFDNAYGVDGAVTTSTNSGILQYGYVTGSKIVGQGASARFSPQTGVRYSAGAHGAVTDSDIEGNTVGGNAHTSAGILLTDIAQAADASTPSGRTFAATGNDLSNNAFALFDANAANTDARSLADPSVSTVSTDVVPATGTFWGCATGPVFGRTVNSGTGVATFTASSVTTGCGAISTNGLNRIAATSTTPEIPATLKPTVDYAGFLTIKPAPLSVPVAKADEPPTAVIAEPVGRPTIAIGETIHPVVQAADDFGVRSVTLSADGAVLQSVGHTPYEFAFTSNADQAGRTVTLTATVTDSAGQITQTSVPVDVAAWQGDGGGSGGSTPEASAASGAEETPGTPATGPGVTPTPPTSGTPSTAGAIVKIKSGLVVASKSKKVTLGTVTCSGTGAGSCTVTLKATVTIAHKRYAITVKATVPQGTTLTLKTTLKGKLAKALSTGKKGTLSATTVVVDAAGAKTTKHTRSTIKLG